MPAREVEKSKMHDSGSPSQLGFTLLELLTVVAVMSILMVVSLPIYFDYATRARVSEGVNLMGEFKTRVTDAYYANGSLPADNAEAGMGLPEEYATDKITRISIGTGGTITVEYDINSLGTDNLLEFSPSVSSMGVDWICQSPVASGVEANYLPSECRR